MQHEGELLLLALAAIVFLGAIIFWHTVVRYKINKRINLLLEEGKVEEYHYVQRVETRWSWDGHPYDHVSYKKTKKVVGSEPSVYPHLYTPYKWMHDEQTDRSPLPNLRSPGVATRF